MRGRVVSIGNALVDVVARVPRLPERGGDVLARSGRLEVGGGGFRALVAARAAGAEALFAGRIGTGPCGDLVRKAFDREGIPCTTPSVEGQDTGSVLVFVEPDGERTFATVPGAEAAPPALDPSAFHPGDHVHVHGYGLVAPGRAAAVADLVAALPDTVVVVLDPGPFGAEAEPAASARLLARADWWSGNAAEARAATGLADRAAAVRLLASSVRAGAVVRDGADGCMLAQRGGRLRHLPAPPVVPVDMTGAGDTLVGAFLAALLQGRPPIDAARRANAAAARFVAAER